MMKNMVREFFHAMTNEGKGAQVVAGSITVPSGKTLEIVDACIVIGETITSPVPVPFRQLADYEYLAWMNGSGKAFNIFVDGVPVVDLVSATAPGAPIQVNYNGLSRRNVYLAEILRVPSLDVHVSDGQTVKLVYEDRYRIMLSGSNTLTCIATLVGRWL